MRRFVRCVAVGLMCLLVFGGLVGGCSQKQEATKQVAKTEPPPPLPPPPPPPPPPPETSLGTLVRVERVSATEIQVLCENPKGLAFIVSGPIDPTLDEKRRFKAKPGQEVYTSGVKTMCAGTEQEQAGVGKTIAVLTFEGQARRSQNEWRTSVTWVVAPQSHYLARTDDKSWLVDAAGKQYNKPFFLATKGKRQLAVVVPADASGLVWHDGKKKAYQLEPTIAELPEAAPARGAPPGKTQ